MGGTALKHDLLDWKCKWRSLADEAGWRPFKLLFSTLWGSCRGRFFSRFAVGIFGLSLSVPGLCAAQSSLSVNVLESQAESTSDTDIHARVVAKRKARLSVEVARNVRTLRVFEGEAFRSGDILVELACAVEEAKLKRSRASLREATEILEANEQLAALKSVGELEFILTQVRVSVAKADVDLASAQMEQCLVRAPFDGVVARAFKREAEYIRSGEPLLDVVDLTNLGVVFLAPARWLAWVKVGDEFTLDLNEIPLSTSGTLSDIGIGVDPVSRTVRLKGDLSGDLGAVAPGMSGIIKFEATR